MSFLSNRPCKPLPDSISSQPSSLHVLPSAQFMFLGLLVSVVFSVIRGMSSGSGGDSNKSSGEKKDDGWGDL